MRSRSLLSSALLHAAVVVGAASWVGVHALAKHPRTAEIHVRPSVPSIPVARVRFVLDAVQVEPFEPEPVVPDVRERPPEPFEEPVPPDRRPEPPIDWRVDAWNEIVDPPPPPEPVALPEPPPVQPAPPQPYVEARFDDAKNQPPNYPSRARQLGHEGEVTLLLRIAASGAVTAVELERGCRHTELNRAALRAARSWVFTPARRHGVAVASQLRYPVHFRLN